MTETRHRRQFVGLLTTLLLAVSGTAAHAQPAENPATWVWPEVVPDEAVRRSIVDGGYTQEELRNIKSELTILAGISARKQSAGGAVRAVQGTGADGGSDAAREAGVQAGARRWPPYFDPSIRFSGRAMKNLEALFGGTGEIDRGMPDRRNRVTGIIAHKDRVWITWMVEGHHTGPMFGLSPTGRFIQAREVSMLRFRDGRITELDMLADEFGLYLQAGGKPGAAKGE
jgi:predicted ester cyclase